MQIRVALDELEPPAGTVQLVSDTPALREAQDGAEIAFAGWLGLLRALSELITAPSSGRPGPGLTF